MSPRGQRAGTGPAPTLAESQHWLRRNLRRVTLRFPPPFKGRGRGRGVDYGEEICVMFRIVPRPGTFLARPPIRTASPLVRMGSPLVRMACPLVRMASPLVPMCVEMRQIRKQNTYSMLNRKTPHTSRTSYTETGVRSAGCVRSFLDFNTYACVCGNWYVLSRLKFYLALVGEASKLCSLTHAIRPRICPSSHRLSQTTAEYPRCLRVLQFHRTFAA